MPDDQRYAVVDIQKYREKGRERERERKGMEGRGIERERKER